VEKKMAKWNLGNEQNQREEKVKTHLFRPELQEKSHP
jgi:hypothetical protein